MANHNIPYTTPGNYTYDSAKIEVSGGLAQLKEDLTDVYARWHLNESSGTNVPDDSGNGRDGTTQNMEDGDWVSAHLNNGLQFDGVDESVNCGNIAAFDRFDPFSCECWINLGPTGGASYSLITKSNTSSVGWLLYYRGTSNAISFLMSSGGSNRIFVIGTTDVADNSWHHVVVTYDGSSDASGVNIYIDNVAETLSISTNALTASILNSGICSIGGRDLTDLFYNGILDEVVVYDREITSSEVTYRWNSGSGRENWYYFDDSPTIEETALFDPADVSSWDTFSETLGGGNEGSVGYNLYKVDKVNKYYWNGSAWVTGGSSSNYNSASVVNTNIPTFDGAPDKIGLVAYLISNGEQAVEIDINTITYTTGNPPNVNAGIDKNALDHDTARPFSDAVISDPDGDINLATAWYDIEGSGWVQIPIGGWATLQEAVRDFQYTFDNVGAVPCDLRIVDVDTFESQDQMIMTVSKHTVTFNVIDLDSGLDIANLSFDPGDGSGVQTVSSPFTWDYDWNATDRLVTITKDSFISVFALSVTTSVHTENVTMIPVTLFEGHIGAQWDDVNSKLIINGWLTRQSRLITTLLTNCLVRIETYDSGGSVTELDNKSTSTFNSRGVAEIEFTSAELGGDLLSQELYAVYMEITWNGTTFSSVIPFTIAKLGSGTATLALQNQILALLQKVDKIESGRWKIDTTTNQMIFYDTDGITPLLTFDLKDSAGDPSVVAVFERVPA